ncbi:hypothetical protein C8R41DRAFT_920672 [Lentinula lateritia]|uniref:NAD-dependent epimerase/dehydratase domain-containing protein n=1 Tax=Lentinula lateritia TaxID=40482 RepID=A0ABQ8VDV1_9AGAR|nr:hypothetical protein C8R41DRAFT_920672 [Lentinula lateritia]
MSPTQQAIVVTGASGYVGSYITYQLLEDGHKVKGVARGEKVSFLQNAFARYPAFEAVEITDIASGDFSFMKGRMDAVIHCAAPMISDKVDHEAALKVFRSVQLPNHKPTFQTSKGAIGGSLHVLEQAKDAGIQKVVVTGSLASFPRFGPYGPNDYFAVTIEEAKSSGNPGVIYSAEKKFAEIAVLEFADKHPEMDVTIICPTFVVGPVAPGFEHLVPTVNFRAFSSTFYLYSLLNGPNPRFPMADSFIDIRDVARAHILALNSQPSSVVGRKRFALKNPDQSNFRQAIELIATERPHLKDRLSPLLSAPKWPESKAEPIDYARMESDLGLKRESLTSWTDTVLDGIDSFMVVENSWKAKGLKVTAPVEMV